MVVEHRANMLDSLMSFGICAVNNFIYIGGGYFNFNEDGITYGDLTNLVDRYDVLHDCWEELKNCNLPFFV